ncbi:DUF6572 domain-containing protein [Candidatus Clostridium radicumherbarum]|uniref:DUF6572 domain-containing protein n=1 Tax=Candidatus Clostridium radicumherbarum TaxID=3381662 RepID=A0ABW8TQJ1_9CLOT
MPIENVNNIDILGVKKDGKGVDLIIVTSKHLDSSPTTQELLLDKIENYLGYINSGEFEKEFGRLDPVNIVIKIKCIDEPDPLMKELFKKIDLWVTENNARIEMIIK